MQQPLTQHSVAASDVLHFFYSHLFPILFPSQNQEKSRLITLTHVCSDRENNEGFIFVSAFTGTVQDDLHTLTVQQGLISRQTRLH